MPNKVAVQEEGVCLWQQLPDSVLLHIFSFLPVPALLKSAQTCKSWYRVALDDLLWKELFYSTWQVDPSVPMSPGKESWLKEFQRLYLNTPHVESEVLQEHRDQVLHVSFAHNGQLFATCSKDGFVKVWRASYPARVLYYADMKEITWKYTQYSQFNETDTLLLVSGVHFGSHSTSGEIAIFSLVGGFDLQCRVLNKPYDIFGTWYNNNYLLSGNLHWLGHLTSCSVLWLNKASQALESEHESVVMRLYKFRNINASSIRTIMIARCNDEAAAVADSAGASVSTAGEGPSHHECRQGRAKLKPNVHQYLSQKLQLYTDGTHHVQLLEVDHNPDDFRENIEYNLDYRQAESSQAMSRSMHLGSREDMDVEASCSGEAGPHRAELPTSQSDGALHSSQHLSGSQTSDANTPTSASMIIGESNVTVQPQINPTGDRYLIFTSGTKTYTPHQIGIKRIRASEATDRMKAKMSIDLSKPNAAPVDPDPGGLGAHGQEEFDTVDHLIELHGHIIGMCLSPDHRYLYVNSRPWPQGYTINDPLCPPPIAQEIDIHVIDLLTIKEVGTMHRAHKAYTPNDECFFIFLDVCEEYVSSGAEDKHGYLWDRHYGVCLTRFPHSDVVNSVAFNPRDPQMLITASDDHSLKIWRSRAREAEIKGHKTIIV